MTGACSASEKKESGTIWKNIQIKALRMVLLWHITSICSRARTHNPFHVLKEIMHKQALNKVNRSKNTEIEFESLTIY